MNNISDSMNNQVNYHVLGSERVVQYANKTYKIIRYSDIKNLPKSFAIKEIEFEFNLLLEKADTIKSQFQANKNNIPLQLSKDLEEIQGRKKSLEKIELSKIVDKVERLDENIFLESDDDWVEIENKPVEISQTKTSSWSKIKELLKGKNWNSTS